jgi:hypothetical protein
MHLWYLLNPYGALTLEVRYIYTFLRLVYDPYWDGKKETLDAMIEEAESLV